LEALKGKVAEAEACNAHFLCRDANASFMNQIPVDQVSSLKMYNSLVLTILPFHGQAQQYLRVLAFWLILFRLENHRGPWTIPLVFGLRNQPFETKDQLRI
jgi:hypothetical protein